VSTEQTPTPEQVGWKDWAWRCLWALIAFVLTASLYASFTSGAGFPNQVEHVAYGIGVALLPWGAGVAVFVMRARKRAANFDDFFYAGMTMGLGVGYYILTAA
jgi:hypothetical protein